MANIESCFPTDVELSRIEHANRPGQIDLFDKVDNRRRYPKGIAVASTGLNRAWKPKTESILQRYTTDWRELVDVK